MDEIIDLCGQARESHASLVVLPLPEEEINRQNEWFQPKIKILEDFIDDVHVWLSEVKMHVTVENEPQKEQQIQVTIQNEPQMHITAETILATCETPVHVETQSENEQQMHVTESERLNDEIGPLDSVSNVANSTHKSTTSKLQYQWYVTN